MTYTWSTFDLDSALSGTLVGFQQTDSYDLSCTGNLCRTIAIGIEEEEGN